MDDPLTVLVVDDKPTTADALAETLEAGGCRAIPVYDGAMAIERLAVQPFDLVLTDLYMDPVDGMEVVKAARALHPPPEVIVFTGEGSVKSAVEAMRLGARDFLTKPVTPEVLWRRLATLRGPAPGTEELPIVGESAFTKKLREDLDPMARVRSTVLLCGEPGVGRLHIARWLHRHGPDTERPFHVLSFSRDLDLDRFSRLGTVLVRRVDLLDEERAEALLRVLDAVPPGEPPRIVATAAETAGQDFGGSRVQEELYYRLAVIVIDVPPIRDRPGDVEPLLQHFSDRFAALFKRSPVRPDEAQARRLRQHPWPGNIREIANLVERATVLGPSVFDLAEPEPGGMRGADPLPVFDESFSLQDHLESVERTLLLRAMEQAGGDRVAMCRLLDLERNTLRYKLKKYDLLKRLQRSGRS